MENFSLVKVEWLDHRERLKPLIDEIALKSNNPELYTTTDKACSDERAFLFLSPDSFCVLQPRHQRQTTYLDIVIAHSNCGDAMSIHLPFIVMLAKKGAAEYIRFYTVRKGFERVAKKHGWGKYGYHRNLAIWRYKL